VSTGISVEVIAQTGSCVMYGDGNVSTHRYHSQMDGAGIITLPNGGYVYVSNSELEGGDGGRSWLMCVIYVASNIAPLITCNSAFF
jgi:hypothetical protein